MNNAQGTPKNLIEVIERIIQATPVNSRAESTLIIEDYLRQRFSVVHLRHASNEDVQGALTELFNIIVYPDQFDPETLLPKQKKD